MKMFSAKRSAAVTGICLGVLVAGTGVASAYSGGNAAAYADRYALTPNGAYYHFDDDCTNFVSQSLWLGGGKAFRGTPTPSVINNRSQWWIWQNGSGRTFSWSVANELWQFLAVYDPNTSGTQLQGFGAQTAYTPNNITTGDPVFYDITNRDGVMDHVSIQVGIGTDALGWKGNLVDEHSNNRKRVIWHLISYNSKWADTGTGERHING